MLRLLAPIVLSALISPPSALSAAYPAPIQAIAAVDGGTLITLFLDSAPFPFEDSRYSDSTVLAFVPRSFRAPSDGKVGMVVHFHGHSETALTALRRSHLVEQLVESQRNAILVVPQLALNAKDSSAGRLERPRALSRLLRDVRSALGRAVVARKLSEARLPRRIRPGQVVVTAHSGGFQGAAHVVKHGGIDVQTLCLFDALFGYAIWIAKWAATPGRRLRVWHGPTRRMDRWLGHLERALQRRKIRIALDEPEGSSPDGPLADAPVVFIRTEVPHSRVPYQSGAMSRCLRHSALPAFGAR